MSPQDRQDLATWLDRQVEAGVLAHAEAAGLLALPEPPGLVFQRAAQLIGSRARPGPTVGSQRAPSSTWRKLDAPGSDVAPGSRGGSGSGSGSGLGAKPAPGTQLGEFVLDHEVGAGAFGTVYRGRDLRSGETVAIKVLTNLNGGGHRELRLRRFYEEARTAQLLEHPNVVRVREVGQHQGLPFLVMDFVEGESLAYALRRREIPDDELLVILHKLALALGAAHEAGVIHRDVKPSNVLVDARGEVFLTDFGLAHDVERTERWSKTGQLMGTPGFLSPEQAAAKPDLICPASDVFAWAATAYFAFSRELPFGEDTLINTVIKVLESDPVPLEELRPDLAPSVLELIARCFAKDPRERPANGRALSLQLQAALEPGGRPRASRRSASGLALGAASLVGLVVGLGLGFGLGPGAESKTASASPQPGASSQPGASPASSGGDAKPRPANPKRDPQGSASTDPTGTPAPFLRGTSLSTRELGIRLLRERYHAEAALYLARALAERDDPELRADLAQAMLFARLVEVKVRPVTVCGMGLARDGQLFLARSDSLSLGPISKAWRPTQIRQDILEAVLVPRREGPPLAAVVTPDNVLSLRNVAAPDPPVCSWTLDRLDLRVELEIACSPEAIWVAGGGRSLLFSVADPKAAPVEAAHPPLTRLAWADDCFLGLDAEGRLHELRQTARGVDQRVRAENVALFAWSPKREALLIVRRDGQLVLEGSTSSKGTSLAQPLPDLLVVDPERARWVLVYRDGRVQVWTTEDGPLELKSTAQHELPSPPLRGQIEPKSGALALAGSFVVEVIDLRTGTLPYNYLVAPPPTLIWFNDRRNTILTGNMAGELAVRGLDRHNPGRSQHALASGPITAFGGGERTVYVGTERGTYLRIEREPPYAISKHAGIQNAGPVRGFFGHGGQMYIVQEGAIGLLPPVEAHTWKQVVRAPKDKRLVWAALIDRTVFALATDGGIYKVKKGTFELTGRNIQALARDHTGELLFASGFGLWQRVPSGKAHKPLVVLEDALYTLNAGVHQGARILVGLDRRGRLLEVHEPGKGRAIRSRLLRSGNVKSVPIYAQDGRLAVIDSQGNTIVWRPRARFSALKAYPTAPVGMGWGEGPKGLPERRLLLADGTLAAPRPATQTLPLRKLTRASIDRLGARVALQHDQELWLGALRPPHEGRSVAAPGPVSALEISPDGSQAAAGLAGGGVFRFGAGEKDEHLKVRVPQQSAGRPTNSLCWIGDRLGWIQGWSLCVETVRGGRVVVVPLPSQGVSLSALPGGGVVVLTEALSKVFSRHTSRAQRRYRHALWTWTAEQGFRLVEPKNGRAGALSRVEGGVFAVSGTTPRLYQVEGNAVRPGPVIPPILGGTGGSLRPALSRDGASALYSGPDNRAFWIDLRGLGLSGPIGPLRDFLERAVLEGVHLQGAK